MCENSVDFCCSCLEQLAGSQTDRPTGVCLGVSDKNHSVNLVCLLPFFVDERKFDVQSVCDCGHPLCPSSVGTHYDCVPPAFDVLLDPLEDGGLRVQVVDGDVEEALDLARVQVHRDYVVCPRHR